MSLPAPAPDQVVLVTGASSGIGSELARQLAALGHELVLVARRGDRLEQLATALRAEHGVEALAVPADLTDGGQRRALIESIRASEKFVAGVCNNAGFGSYERVAEADAAMEAAMVQLNVAAYVAMPGTGWKAASEATLRIAPARRSTIGRRNASVSSWTAATLSCTIAASIAASASATRS